MKENAVMIQGIEDNILATILMTYYIKGKTWEETADAIGYSYGHTVHRLHTKALQSF